jgi:hypothetical protein
MTSVRPVRGFLGAFEFVVALQIADLLRSSPDFHVHAVKELVRLTHGLAIRSRVEFVRADEVTLFPHEIDPVTRHQIAPLIEGTNEKSIFFFY